MFAELCSRVGLLDVVGLLLCVLRDTQMSPCAQVLLEIRLPMVH